MGIWNVVVVICWWGVIIVSGVWIGGNLGVGWDGIVYVMWYIYVIDFVMF